MSKNTPIHTYQTRVECSVETDNTLSAYAKLMSTVGRHLFAEVMKGNSALSLKNTFLKRFYITARQFNGCRVQVEGKIASIRQLNSQRIRDLKESIKKLEDSVAGPKRRNKTKTWLSKQRLGRLNSKLSRLENDHETGKVSLCFGSRKLFRSQFNEDLSHEEWRKNWEEQRNREFFAIGSKDETAGNQTCKATVADNGSISLLLRLPVALSQGKYLELHQLRFHYGHDAIVAGIQDCQLRKDLLKKGDPSYENHGQAISYRFLKDSKGWRVFVSTALAQPEWITNRRLGVVGLDINVDHLAIVETDRFGNPVYHERIPCVLYGKNQHQSRAIIGDACARAVKIAAEARKPLIVEELDFARKKKELKERSSSYCRMISSFAYSTLLQALRSRAYRSGVELFSVNPAFTSLLGRIKFAARYGLTTHHAAALCIARRYQGFSESLPSTSSVPDGKGGHIAFSVPVRNQEKHEWQYLRETAKKLRAALAEHFRVASGRSSSLSKKGLSDEQSSKFVGEIPARESLATLLG